MPGPFKQTRAAFSMFMLWGCALFMMTGCPSVDTTTDARCDAARRCATGVAEVCGEDGKTYACNALARCEGVIVDPSGQACMIDSPDMCQDMACPNMCPVGYIRSTGADGCTTCNCEPVACPDVQPPECGPDQRTVCDADDFCGTSCTCEPLNCELVACNLFCAEGFKTGPDGCEVCECNDTEPVCSDERDAVQCPPGTDWECVVGRNGEPRWSCEPVVCADGLPVCDEDAGEVLICENGDDGCQKCWCDELNCPDVEPPSCFANQRTECVPGDVCGTSCWCEDLMCPPLNEVDCDDGEPVRRVDGNGCSYMFCPSATCLAIACPETVCPYGPDRDESGCDTCECYFPEPCPGEPECDLFCEYGQVEGADGCLTCACNPPPLCEPIECDDVICPGGYLLDDAGCQTCECAPIPGCLDDEQCGLYEACVFDFSDPEPCCPPDVSCADIFPACVGECQAQAECVPGQGCSMGESCDAIDRDDCCHPAALTCLANLPICPLLCLDQNP